MSFIALTLLIGLHVQGFHCAGISGNQEMLGNSAEVREKSGKGRGICVVMEIWNLWQLSKITYQYFIRTVIHFLHTWCSRIIWINKCAFVRHIACNIVSKSAGFFHLEIGKSHHQKIYWVSQWDVRPYSPAVKHLLCLWQERYCMSVTDLVCVAVLLNATSSGVRDMVVFTARGEVKCKSFCSLVC